MAAQEFETAKATAAEWARVRVETADLQDQWQWERQFLENMIAAQEARLKQLRQELEQEKAETALRDESRTRLSDEQESAFAVIDSAGKTVAMLQGRLVSLRPYLPPRLSEALELPFVTLCDSSREVPERWQAAVNILNRCSTFNRSIIQAEEVIKPSDGEQAELMEVIYWGLGHGYALNRGAGMAYRGHPGADGWTWEAMPDAAAAVAKMLAVHKEDAEPIFLSVPFEVSGVPANQREASK